MTELAYDFPILNIFFTVMWVALWVMWFFLLARVFMDLFRDGSLSGWAKAGWSVFVLVLPFLGVFVYLLARGRGMGEREVREVQKAEQEFRTYVQEAVAGTPKAGSPVDELAKLAELKHHGDISEEEYQSAKTHLLAA